MMSDVIKIPQVLFYDYTDPKQCCVAINDGENPCKPVIRCICGEYTNIALHHVHADGKVTNSFYHTNGNPCGWHVFIFLENYAEKVGLEFLPEK